MSLQKRLRLIVTNITILQFQPLDVNVYEDSLYWLLSNTGNIRKCKLNGKTTCTTVNSPVVIKHFTIFHDTVQPSGKNCTNTHFDRQRDHCTRAYFIIRSTEQVSRPRMCLHVSTERTKFHMFLSIW